MKQRLCLVLLLIVLTGCSVFRPGRGDPLATATSIGRVACALMTSEGGSAEIRATHAALDAIDSVFAHDGAPPPLVLLPHRIQGYVALLLAESAERTTEETHAAIRAFVIGCRQTLAPLAGSP